MTNYRCVVTLKNGAHKVVRVMFDEVAHVVAKFREMQRSIWNDVVLVQVGSVILTLNDILSMIFINEYTGEEYLSIA